MTIFFEIVKALIIDKLQKEKSRSERKDEKAYIRNTELSKAKQMAAETAIKSVQNMTCLATDMENFLALAAIINTCKAVAKKESDNLNLDEGKHGPEMIRIGALLASIYESFKNDNLLDVKLDRSFDMVLVSIDPKSEIDFANLEGLLEANQKPVLLCQGEMFSIYGFCGKAELIPLDNRFFSHLKFPEEEEVICLENLQVTEEMRQEILKVTDVPARDPYTIYRFNIASFIASILEREHYPVKHFPKLTAEKKKAALEALECCEKSLSWLDTKIPEYLNARKGVVIASLEKLQKKNFELCKKYELVPSLPFSITMFAQANVGLATFTPDKGCLSEYITKAMTEIDPSIPVQKEQYPVETGNYYTLASLLS